MLRVIFLLVLSGVALAAPVCLEEGTFAGMVVGVIIGSILLTILMTFLLIRCCLGSMCKGLLSWDS